MTQYEMDQIATLDTLIAQVSNGELSWQPINTVTVGSSTGNRMVRVDSPNLGELIVASDWTSSSGWYTVGQPGSNEPNKESYNPFEHITLTKEDADL